MSSPTSKYTLSGPWNTSWKIASSFASTSACGYPISANTLRY